MQPLKPRDDDASLEGQRIGATPHPARYRGRVLVFGLYGLALFVLLIELAPRHGPWFDEFWTRFFSDPSISLAEAFNNRWVADVHPPLFSFLAWMAAHVHRLPIEQARLLNFVPLGSLATYMVLLGRSHPRERPFLGVLAVSLGSSTFFIDYFVEFRSYFTGLCAFAGLTMTLVAQDRRQPGDTTGTRLLWCGYAVTLIVSLNIHYLTTAMTVVLVAVFAIAAAIRGEWRRFAIYLVSGIAASAPFIGFVAYQWSTIARITHDYWLKTSMPAAVDMIAKTLVTPTWEAQILVSLAWLASAILLWRGKMIARLDRTAVILLVALIAEIGLLLVYTWATAALTERYLIPLSILSASLFSVVLSRPIYETPWLLWLFTITNLLGIVPTAVDRWHDPRWDEAAQYLATRQKSCPGARIVPMQQDLNDHTPNTVQNYNEAYGYMARKWGLTLGEVDTPSPRPRDASCADYYWADHFYGLSQSNETLLAKFGTRWPTLNGCQIKSTAFTSGSAVFEVSGEAPACNR